MALREMLGPPSRFALRDVVGPIPEAYKVVDLVWLEIQASFSGDCVPSSFVRQYYLDYCRRNEVRLLNATPLDPGVFWKQLGRAARAGGEWKHAQLRARDIDAEYEGLSALLPTWTRDSNGPAVGYTRFVAAF